MPTIKLESADGIEFEVDLEVAKCSTTIRSMLEDLHCPLEETDNEPVPLPNVNGDILKLIIEWATHHVKEAIAQLEHEDNEDMTITPWEQKYLKDNDSQMVELVLAANYLDVKRLLDIACHALASQIKGRTPEEIKKRLVSYISEED